MNKKYMLSVLLNDKNFWTAQIEFLQREHIGHIIQVIAIKLHCDNEKDFSYASNAIFNTLWTIQNQFRRPNEILSWAISWDTENSIIFYEWIADYKSPRLYKKEYIIKRFLRQLQL